MLVVAVVADDDSAQKRTAQHCGGGGGGGQCAASAYKSAAKVRSAFVHSLCSGNNAHCHETTNCTAVRTKAHTSAKPVAAAPGRRFCTQD